MDDSPRGRVALYIRAQLSAIKALRSEFDTTALTSKTHAEAIRQAVQAGLRPPVFEAETADERLAMLLAWLVGPEKPRRRSPPQDAELIDCTTAASLWGRSVSWWRERVGDGKPIPVAATRGRGRGVKLFRRSDAEALARRLSIPLKT